jgi:hypothetical protein
MPTWGIVGHTPHSACELQAIAAVTYKRLAEIVRGDRLHLSRQIFHAR